MWIRSKDRKTLVNVDQITIINLVVWNKACDIKLGEYTENRAIQILDDIQERIKSIEALKALSLNKYLKINTFDSKLFVFNMPKE